MGAGIYILPGLPTRRALACCTSYRVPPWQATNSSTPLRHIRDQILKDAQKVGLAGRVPRDDLK